MRLKQMERTIEQLKRNKEKTEMRIRTDSKLRTKQNTRLVIWNNTLKFENAKQTTILQKKKIEQKALNDTLSDLKRKEVKERRKYNEMSNTKGGSSRASSAVPRGAAEQNEPMLDRNDSAKGRAQSRQNGRVSSAARLSQTADAHREEEQDKARVEQLNRQIEMNNAEILDNWDQIAIMKRNIFRVVQAR